MESNVTCDPVTDRKDSYPEDHFHIRASKKPYTSHTGEYLWWAKKRRDVVMTGLLALF